VLDSHLSVRPGADISLGLAGSDPTFGVTVGYNFGISRRSPVSSSAQNPK
jgi:hypothetical protein